MSTLKKHKVVMLPTNEKASTIWKTTSGQLIHTHVSGEYKEKYQPQHLYILSDEEIKEGDCGWLFEDGRIKSVCRFDCTKGLNGIRPTDKKIIATTDKSLGLASPSTSFIEKFVEEYNKDNVITDVMVEYEELARAVGKPLEKLDSGVDDFDKKIIGHKLKINPKDNTITIKKVKDSWSREEVIDLLTRYNKRCQAPMVDTKWISENL